MQAVRQKQALFGLLSRTPTAAAADHLQHMAPERGHMLFCHLLAHKRQLGSVTVWCLRCSCMKGMQQEAACRLWSIMRACTRCNTAKQMHFVAWHAALPVDDMQGTAAGVCHVQ